MQKDSILLFIKKVIKKFPKLKHWAGLYVDHFYEDFSGYKAFIKNNAGKRFKLNIGAGSTQESFEFINLDLHYFPGVNVCGDVHRLPFKNDSIDAIRVEQVIEHIDDPRRMIDEIRRVLKPEGEIYITAPFMYPFHEAPVDFSRWTLDGFHGALKGFSPVMSGVLGGPTATLIEALHGWLSVLFSFNSEKMFQIVYLLLLPFLKPFKIVDLLLMNKLKSAYRLAAIFYFYGKKNSPSW